ncbi:MAG: hypothetical protein ACKPKO_30070, partial [Candidatus Fonsibacter sp.]
ASRIMLLSVATRYDAEMVTMKRDMNMMSTEMQAIRASAATGQGSSELWAMKCSTKAERDREDAERRVALLSHQLVEVRAEGTEARSLAEKFRRERAEYIPREEHIQAMKSKQDEFLSELKLHLTKGFGDLRKSHVAEVQSLKVERDETVARLEVDRQHFVKALAESMN